MNQLAAPQIRVRVPAKVMLAGEYAVLAGGRALAASLDCWLQARLEPSSNLGLRVSSNLWREPRNIDPYADPEQWKDTPLLHAVAAAARHHGITSAALHIDSAIEVSYGIGSSSALRLAVCMAMATAAKVWPHQAAPSNTYPYDINSSDGEWQAARMAVALQRAAQGSASGYDVATQFVGGLVSFQGAEAIEAWPGSVSVLPASCIQPLSNMVQVYVGGSGAPTGPLLQSTRSWLISLGRWEEFCQLSENLVTAFTTAFMQPDSPNHQRELYRACAAHRRILSAAPQFPLKIAAALAEIPGLDEYFSWKTTGAGGDDAILLLGPASYRAQAAAVLQSLGRKPLAWPFTAHGVAIAAPQFPHQPNHKQSDRSFEERTVAP